MEIPTSITTRLQYQHKVLVDLIDGLTDQQIRQAVNPGKWSIFENVAHLTAYQHTFITRIKQILSENNPLFQTYTADSDLLFRENCLRSTREVMKDLLSTRKEMVADFPTFQPNDYSKTGQHPDYGIMNILQWANCFLLHEAHHLYAIFKMAAEIKKRR